MDREKKKTIALAVLLSLAVITAVVYFFWGNFIDRGTLKVIAEAPFTVEIFDKGSIRESINCKVSPCLIKQRSGQTDLLIKKDGYKSLLSDVYIKLWRTVEIHPDLLLIPQIEETEFLPEIREKIEYELVTDDKTEMQKLVKIGDKNLSAIVYFKPPINQPAIISGKDFALVIDQLSEKPAAYIVDIDESKRTFVSNEELKNISDGIWSNDGKYLALSKTDSPYLWIFERETLELTQTSLKISLKFSSWTLDHDLIFVTDQTYRVNEDDTFTTLEEKSLEDVTFGIFQAENQTYDYLGSFREIGGLPDKFIPTTNGGAIYFSIADKNFRIFLRKF